MQVYNKHPKYLKLKNSIITGDAFKVIREKIVKGVSSYWVQINSFEYLSMFKAVSFKDYSQIEVISFRGFINDAGVQIWIDTLNSRIYASININETSEDYWSDVDNIYANITFDLLDTSEIDIAYNHVTGLEIDFQNSDPIEDIQIVLSAIENAMAERKSKITSI